MRLFAFKKVQTCTFISHNIFIDTNILLSYANSFLGWRNCYTFKDILKSTKMVKLLHNILVHFDFEISNMIFRNY